MLQTELECEKRLLTFDIYDVSPLPDLDPAPGAGGVAPREDGASEYSTTASGATGALGRGAEGFVGGAERRHITVGGGA